MITEQQTRAKGTVAFERGVAAKVRNLSRPRPKGSVAKKLTR